MCCIFKCSIGSHIFYANLLERSHNFASAKTVYSNLLKGMLEIAESMLSSQHTSFNCSDLLRSSNITPQNISIDAIINTANFLRRHNEHALAISLFDIVINQIDVDVSIFNTVIINKAMYISDQFSDINESLCVVLGLDEFDIDDISDTYIATYEKLFQSAHDLCLVKCAYELIMKFPSSRGKDTHVCLLTFI
jgi:hypothetical protein